ncbi:hypothetical protein EI94DRAFT_1696881 [Lactarius quietus]|nr:hypothetical protein EI94DRAFT_1696881 [Lactarius quietus]
MTASLSMFAITLSSALTSVSAHHCFNDDHLVLCSDLRFANVSLIYANSNYLACTTSYSTDTIAYLANGSILPDTSTSLSKVDILVNTTPALVTNCIIAKPSNAFTGNWQASHTAVLSQQDSLECLESSRLTVSSRANATDEYSDIQTIRAALTDTAQPSFNQSESEHFEAFTGVPLSKCDHPSTPWAKYQMYLVQNRVPQLELVHSCNAQVMHVARLEHEDIMARLPSE